jgi:hypothetical protein
MRLVCGCCPDTLRGRFALPLTRSSALDTLRLPA